jgi:hypothetical protein
MSQVLEDHEFHYRVRPRFHVETPYSVEDISDRINSELKKEGAACRGWVNPHYAKLFIPTVDQHYWSPHLSVSFEEEENGKTTLRGIYGPRPAVWTMFVFFYAFIGFAILILAILGTSYMSLGKSGAILWLIPVLCIIFLTLYLVSYFGQKLGHDQMVVLHHFMEECIGQKIDDD